MASPPPTSLYEQRLIKELAEIDARIAELQIERRSVERLLIRARRETMAGHDVTRKNSLSRALIEMAVIDALTKAKASMRTRDLFLIARDVDFSLKDVTFRSHLHRMKLRGLLKSIPNNSGWWRLPSRSDAVGVTVT